MKNEENKPLLTGPLSKRVTVEDFGYWLWASKKIMTVKQKNFKDDGNIFLTGYKNIFCLVACIVN